MHVDDARGCGRATRSAMDWPRLMQSSARPRQAEPRRRKGDADEMRYLRTCVGHILNRFDPDNVNMINGSCDGIARYRPVRCGIAALWAKVPRSFDTRMRCLIRAFQFRLYEHRVMPPMRACCYDAIGMSELDVKSLVRAAADRREAVSALQKKYEASKDVPAEQLVQDMRELLATERVVLDAIVTLFVELGHSVDENTVSIATSAPHPPQTQPTLAP